MNLRYIIIVVLIIAIIGMLALLWPAYQNVSAKTTVQQSIDEPVKLAESFEELEKGATANHRQAVRIADTFKAMQQPVNVAALENPFETPASVMIAAKQANGGKQPNGSKQGGGQQGEGPDPVEVQVAQLRLMGTLAAGSASMAVINNEVYRIGDIVNGLRIMTIGEDGVGVAGSDRKERLLPLRGWQTVNERVKP